MIYYKTDEEVELMRQSCHIVSRTHEAIATALKPGMTTLELDGIAEEYIRSVGAIPGFKDYRGFPYTLCISSNEEVVHGMPGKRVIEEGDIISVDCGVVINDFYGDQAYTYIVGEIPEETMKLLRVTKESLYKGIDQAVKGKRIGDISNAIQSHAERQGYGVVRELVGHGIGRELHESPEVPNFGRRGSGLKLQDGLVLAIEPMINMGTRKVVMEDDGWTIVTQDEQPSAHFEHTVVVRAQKADILTTFEWLEEAIRANTNLSEVL